MITNPSSISSHMMSNRQTLTQPLSSFNLTLSSNAPSPNRAAANVIKSIETDNIDMQDQSWQAFLIYGPASFCDIHLNKISPTLKRFFGETQVEGQRDPIPWAEYLGIPDSLRTAHVNRLLYLATVRGAMLKGAFDAVDVNLFRAIRHHGKHIAEEIGGIYLQYGSLPQLFNERMIEEVEKTGEPVNAMRVVLDITSVNKVDKSGKLATVLLKDACLCLQKELGTNNVFIDQIGTAFNVILGRNPNRDAIAEIMDNLANEIHRMLEIDDRIEGKRIPKSLSIKPLAMIESFALQSGLSKDDLTKAINAFRRQLAADTVYIEKFPQENGGNLTAYHGSDDSVLPTEGTTEYHTLEKWRAQGKGYVGMEPYDMSQDARTTRLQPFCITLTNDRLSLLRKVTNYYFGRNGSQKAALDGLSAGLLIGAQAMFDVQTPSLIKNTDLEIDARGVKRIMDPSAGVESPSFENVNFFAQEVAQRGYRNLVLFEYDNLKRFNLTHSPHEDGRAFLGVIKHWFDACEALGLNAPLIQKFQGDLIAVALPEVDSIEELVKEVQANIHLEYSKKPYKDFQIEIKVLSRNDKGKKITKRLKLWRYKKTGALYALSSAPWPKSKYRPVKRHLTISIAFHRMPHSLRCATDLTQFVKDLYKIGSFIDERLKTKKSLARVLEAENGVDIDFVLDKASIGEYAGLRRRTGWYSRWQELNLQGRVPLQKKAG